MITNFLISNGEGYATNRSDVQVNPFHEVGPVEKTLIKQK